MALSYVALGSNLGEPLKQVREAVRLMAGIARTRVLDHSPWYQSSPIGPPGQADYVNGVARLETDLAADALLQALQAIENRQGRRRELHWGPRTLDLDILLYDGLVCNTPDLCLPHPRMRERAFVLRPLYDLAPELELFKDASILQLIPFEDTPDLKKLAE